MTSAKPLISPKVSAGSAVSGTVNLAGSEKCYGNKSCIKLTVGVLLYQEILKISFQAPDDPPKLYKIHI